MAAPAFVVVTEPLNLSQILEVFNFNDETAAPPNTVSMQLARSGADGKVYGKFVTNGVTVQWYQITFA